MGWTWGIAVIMIIGLFALFMALCAAQEGTPPDEEARLIREQAEEQRRKAKRRRK